MTIKRIAIAASIVLLAGAAAAQMTPWFQWTFLPANQMDEIIGEVSGETAFNHILTMSGYPRDRKAAEYAGTFWEAQYVLDRLKEYGLADAAIVRFPGGETWDGVKGELWEVKPGRQKIASYQDLTAMLASGSAPADVTAELIWVGEGEAKDFTGFDVTGKLSSPPARPAASIISPAARKALSVLFPFLRPGRCSIPLIIPWSGIGGRGGRRRPNLPSVSLRGKGSSSATG